MPSGQRTRQRRVLDDGDVVFLGDLADMGVNVHALVAKAIDSPVAFTAKILQILSRNNIVQSLKGPTGGFEIEHGQIAHTKLSQIVFAIDGDKIYQGCGLGLSKCDAEKPCPVHFQFVAIRDEMQRMLEETSVLELAEGLAVWSAGGCSPTCPGGGTAPDASGCCRPTRSAPERCCCWSRVAIRRPRLPSALA